MRDNGIQLVKSIVTSRILDGTVIALRNLLMNSVVSDVAWKKLCHASEKRINKILTIFS